MSKKNDGGPAFPSVYQVVFPGGKVRGRVHLGISLRDYFAAQALGGMKATGHWQHRSYWEEAVDAYRYADEMLKAREENGE